MRHRLATPEVNPFLLQCFFTVRRKQSNFFRYHFGLEWKKRKIVRKVHAKRVLQTAPHRQMDNHNLHDLHMHKRHCSAMRKKVNRLIELRKFSLIDFENASSEGMKSHSGVN